MFSFYSRFRPIDEFAQTCPLVAQASTNEEYETEHSTRNSFRCSALVFWIETDYFTMGDDS